jgi:HD-GYP domain-containing protein (c-di-GMP phosphodiesterase class II)
MSTPMGSVSYRQQNAAPRRLVARFVVPTVLGIAVLCLAVTLTVDQVGRGIIEQETLQRADRELVPATATVVAASGSRLTDAQEAQLLQAWATVLKTPGTRIELSNANGTGLLVASSPAREPVLPGFLGAAVEQVFSRIERIRVDAPVPVDGARHAGLTLHVERQIGAEAPLVHWWLAASLAGVALGSVIALGLPARRAVDFLKWAARSEAELSDARQDLVLATQSLLLHADGTLRALVAAIDERDSYTGSHSTRCAEISVIVGRRMGLPENQLGILENAALLHDIGKIGIPDSVLLKKGPLTGEEFAIVSTHPVRGAELLVMVPSTRDLAALVRHHHEWWNGMGYPDGLVAEQIPLLSRPISVADALDAMTSDRPYRSALSLEDAIAEIEQRRGTQFCPQAVDALLAAAADGELRADAQGPGSATPA